MELVKKEETRVAVDIPEELREMFGIENNMEGVIPRLPQIGIIHRGQMFEMPDDSKITEFEGVILDQHPANAWWEKDISESGGGSIPDCFSLNGSYPVEECNNKQNNECSSCPQNQFGSDGKGKACKNMKRLHILMEGSSLPRRLTVPPTSIRSFDNYMTELVDRGLPFSCAVTNFSLVKKTSDSFEFAEVKFHFKRVLSRDELYVVADSIKKFKDEARKQDISTDEYVSADTNNNNDEGVKTPQDDIPF